MKAIIVAYADNRVIGKQGDLPWYLPADLKRFKTLTSGHTVIMGRKTLESILKRLGTILPNRRSIVLTRDPSYDGKGATIAASLDEAIKIAGNDDTFIIGGESVFAEALPIVDRLYVTEVKAAIDGDVFMPQFDISEWQEINRESHLSDPRHQYDFDFVTYNRA